MEEAARPAASQASRTRTNAAAESPTEWNGTLYSSAYLAARRGVRRAPEPPTITGGRRRRAPFGNPGAARRGEGVPPEGDGSPPRGFPKPREVGKTPPPRPPPPPGGAEPV